MTNIHPTAVIEDGAQIAASAKIGPLCWISSRAKIGENVQLLGRVTVMGDTTIGEGTIVFPGAVLGAGPQDHGNEFKEEAKLINFKEINKVAFITNFDQRDLIAFDSLITTFKDYNFEIYFIHLNSNEERRTWNEIKLSGIKEYFHKQYPDLKINYSLVTEDSFFNNLDDYVREENIDVLCVSNYKRNVFARLFNPSIAKKMIFHSRTPILIIK